MKVNKTIQTAEIIQATKQQRPGTRGSQIPPAPHFDVIEFINQPRIDPTCLLAFVK